MNFKKLTKFNHEKTKNYILRCLITNIVTFSIEPGEKISENQISELLHVSRTPVREAFNELESSMLLDVKAQVGSFVSYIDIDMTEELLFFRTSLETSALSLLSNKPNLNLSKFEKILDKENLYLENKDYENLIKIDNEFHKTIFELLGYQKIPSIIRKNSAYIDRIRFLGIKDNIRDNDYTEDHVKIVKLLRDGESDGLIELINNHINFLNNDMDLLKLRYPEYFN